MDAAEVHVDEVRVNLEIVGVKVDNQEEGGHFRSEGGRCIGGHGRSEGRHSRSE